MFQDWGDWMCLVQDDVDFEKAEDHINVEVGKEAVTSLTWGGHQHGHDLGNKIEKTQEPLLGSQADQEETIG